MESYRAEWDQARDDYIKQNPNWETEHGEELIEIWQPLSARLKLSVKG